MASTFWRELNSDLDNRKMKEQSAPALPLPLPCITQLKSNLPICFFRSTTLSSVQNILLSKHNVKSGLTTKYQYQHAATFFLFKFA